MKRYLLTFKNDNIEKQYQTTCIGQTRMRSFKLIILCFLITLSIRIVQCIMNNNDQYVITNAIMMVFLSLLYIITRKYQRIIRISLFLLNHVFTIYLLLINETNDAYSFYFRGVNQMGTNLLIIFCGEFIDGVISLISLQSLRVIIVFMKSSDIEFSTIFAGLFLVGYASIQLHGYHKGLRSQFLLSIKDEQWDNIFTQIIKDIPYLLLTFDDECLKFQVQSFENCEKFITNKEEVSSFLKQPTKTGQTLEQLIHQEIKSYQSKCKENFNNITNIYINKQQLLLEYSIFNGNKPIILLVFKDIHKQYYQTQIYKKQLNYKNYFFNFFFKLCSKLKQTEDKNYYLDLLQRKFYIIKQIKNFKPNNYHFQNIDMKNFFKQLQQLYPKKVIYYNTVYCIKIETILPLFNLFFLNLMECLQSQKVTIYFQPHIHQYLELIILGKFDIEHLDQMHKKFNPLFNLIIDNFQISHESNNLLQLDIKLHLFSSAFVPFIL